MGPDSLLRQHGGDVRVLGAAGYTVVLQLAYPTVAAAVTQHSAYKRDLWGRLLRSVDYLFLMSFAGAANAAANARCLRAKHAPIRGVLPGGRRYTAFEPEAWSWVHATLMDGGMVGIERFCGPLSAAERNGLWAEWLAVGRRIGVRPDALPTDWAGYLSYREQMLTERLEPSDAIHEFLAMIREPPPPQILPWWGQPGWGLLRQPLGHVLALITIGLLPSRFREACGLSWTARQELELRGMAAAVRALGPVLPPALRNMGPRYLEWRRQPIAADFACHGVSVAGSKASQRDELTDALA